LSRVEAHLRRVLISYALTTIPNTSVFEQGCTDFSSDSSDGNHSFTTHPRRLQHHYIWVLNFRIKPEVSAEDVYTRAERALRECIIHGTTRIGTQVEVDPRIGMRGFDAIEKLAEDYRWAADVQICVFPQDGLTNVPGTEELLIRGLQRGASVIGAAPRYDTDGPEQIRRIFALAREFDVDIDMHLDVGTSPEHLDVHLVAELTERYGVCTENFIRVDDAPESPKLAE
jgi:cytosine deaminase